MRKLKELYRLHYEVKLSNRAIGRACGISSSTVWEYLDRAQQKGLNYSRISKMSQEELNSILSPVRTSEKKELDMNYIHKELKRPSITLQLLWEEYKSNNPSGYGRSQYFKLYRQWRKELNPVMRMEHKAGEKLFVDFSGDRPHYIDRTTGEIIYAELFVGVLGASSYIFACAVKSQKLEDWLRCHVLAFEYFGGCPEIVVPDNLKSGVKKSCIYDPDINPAYMELADHYGVAILPARPGKPRDKAKVENGVLQAQRWVLACIRNLSFFSLSELNTGIRGALDKLNDRPMQVLKKSRFLLFEEIDKPALKPLPRQRFKFFDFKGAKVHIDYHIEVEKSYYSVPYKYIHKKVDVRYNDLLVEIYYQGNRICSHMRSYKVGYYSTQESHRPHCHSKYLEWTPDRIKSWARKIGTDTERLMEEIMSSRRHAEHGYRACLGILRLSKKYTPERLENACNRALLIGGISYRSVSSILEKGLDKAVIMTDEDRGSKSILHKNLRGNKYYQEVSNV
jgi:transposase